MADSPPVLPDAILGPDRAGVEGDRPALQAGTMGSVTPLVHQEAASPVRDGGVVLKSPGVVAGPAGPPGGAAVSKKSRDTALIAQRDARIRKKATDIVLSALRTPELAELGELAKDEKGDVIPPSGWTKRGLKIANDANNSMKAAPAYLGMAQRILESYRKAESDENKPAPVLNATQVVVHQEFHYPTIKVER